MLKPINLSRALQIVHFVTFQPLPIHFKIQSKIG